MACPAIASVAATTAPPLMMIPGRATSSAPHQIGFDHTDRVIREWVIGQFQPTGNLSERTEVETLP